jgi:hypothetical protein
MGGKARPTCKAYNLTVIYEPIVGVSTSHNTMGFYGQLGWDLHVKMVACVTKYSPLDCTEGLPVI